MFKAAVGTLLLAFFWGHNSFAVDTSGCSQLVVAQSGQNTALGGVLIVRSSKAPRANCWNAADSSVQISYQWQQSNPIANASDVNFWTRINGREQTVASYASCEVSTLGGPKSFTCHAVGSIKTGETGPVTVEVAPERSGSWDTHGYGTNYLFNL